MVPSASITSALKKDKGLPPVGVPVIDPALIQPPLADTLPMDGTSGFGDLPGRVDPALLTVSPLGIEPVPDAVLRKLGAGPVAQTPDQTIFDAQVASAQPQVLYPELNGFLQPMSTGKNNGNVVKAGKPRFINGDLILPNGLQMHLNAPVKVETAVPKPIESKTTPPVAPSSGKGKSNIDKGLPIDMQLFSQMS